jgi:hypothetical protein
MVWGDPVLTGVATQVEVAEEQPLVLPLTDRFAARQRTRRWGSRVAVNRRAESGGVDHERQAATAGGRWQLIDLPASAPLQKRRPPTRRSGRPGPLRGPDHPSTLNATAYLIGDFAQDGELSV